MQTALLLIALGFGHNEQYSTPTLSLQKRERQGWGNLSSKLGKVGPAPDKNDDTKYQQNIGPHDSEQQRDCMTSTKHDKALDADSLFVKAEKYEEKGDLGKAFKHLSRAAAQLGHHMSQLNLGQLLTQRG